MAQTNKDRQTARMSNTQQQANAAKKQVKDLLIENQKLKQRIAEFQGEQIELNGTASEYELLKQKFVQTNEELVSTTNDLCNAEKLLNDKAKIVEQQRDELQAMSLHPRVRAVNAVSKILRDLIPADQHNVLCRIIQDMKDMRQMSAETTATIAKTAKKRLDDFSSIADSFQ